MALAPAPRVCAYSAFDSNNDIVMEQDSEAQPTFAFALKKQPTRTTPRASAPEFSLIQPFVKQQSLAAFSPRHASQKRRLPAVRALARHP